MTGPSGDENAGGSGRAKAKGKGHVGSHAKPEDIVLLFDLLARLDPKGGSDLEGHHLTVKKAAFDCNALSVHLEGQNEGQEWERDSEPKSEHRGQEEREVVCNVHG